MTTATDWRSRVGDAWAAEWRRTDRSFTNLDPHLNGAILAAAAAGPGAALDIGCGAGATTAALLAARPGLAVTGVDLSSALVAVARQRVPDARFLVADAATDPIDLRPDLLFSRHGVMFFADPVAAFTRLRALAAPGAGLVFSCFRDRARNAFVGDLVVAVTGERPADSSGYAPGPFSFASRDFVAGILAAAGWSDAAATSIDFDYLAGEGDDPIADAAHLFTRIGPLASIIAAAPSRAELTARLTDVLARYQVANRVILPASAWIWRARAGEPA